MRFAQSPRHDLYHRESRNVTGQILLVEADVVLGAVLAEVLRHNGYEVSVVNTLVKGEIYHVHSVSAVILDIDTTSAEKELAWLDWHQPYGESLPIILLGLDVSQEPNHRLCVDLGHRQTNVLIVVQKPFRNEELLDALRQVQESSLPGQTTEI
jgi:DNA-binding response OmpR family regulator